MQKIITKLRKKLKKQKALNKKLSSDIVEYHHDIIILDQNNFSQEQDISKLQAKLKECEDIYLKDTKSEFDKHLQKLLIDIKDIKKEDSSFYINALKYISGYIEALQKYGDGDTKAIMDKIDAYKSKAIQSQTLVQQLRRDKKTLFKKLNAMSKEIGVFKSEVAKSIL